MLSFPLRAAIPTSLKPVLTHFDIDSKVLFAVKDSNAAPSPPNATASNAGAANAGAPKGSRGKVAAPKAKAKAVSKAKARVKAKNAAPKKAAASATIAPTDAAQSDAPAVEASPATAAPATKARPADVAPIIAPAAEPAPQSVTSGAQTAAATAKPSEAAAKSPAQPAITPEIPFPEILTPKVAANKTSEKTPTKMATATAQKSGAAKTANATLANGTPANGTPANGTPANGTPANGTPKNSAVKTNTPKAAPAGVAANSGAVAGGAVAGGAVAGGAKTSGAKASNEKTNAAKTSGAKASGAGNSPVTPATSSGAKLVANGKPVAAARGRAVPKFRPLYVFAALAALVLTTAGGVAVGSYHNWSNSQVIAPKVRIAGESIGGMTREQAVAHLNKRFAKLAFTLQTDDKNIVLGLADVGGKPSIAPTVDKAFAIGRSGGVVDNFARVFGAEVKPRSFSLPIEWNRGALTSRLQIVEQQYARPAVDARLIAVSGGAPRVTIEESGRALDVSATADAIQKSYFLGLRQVEAVTGAVEPKLTAADLQGHDVKLGEYRTEYNNGIAGRTTNIHVACRAVDGTVLMPGEVLSFNGLTGERTYKKGYRMAHIFLREAGQSQSSIVDGLAGGVCQVSSTLYNAVRKTNAQFAGKPLGIVERSSHSLPVTYVPRGRDATVAWPNKDFKFRNDNSFPVYVRTHADNGRLTISIWGRVPQNQTVPVSLEN